MRCCCGCAYAVVHDARLGIRDKPGRSQAWRVAPCGRGSQNWCPSYRECPGCPRLSHNVSWVTNRLFRVYGHCLIVRTMRANPCGISTEFNGIQRDGNAESREMQLRPPFLPLYPVSRMRTMASFRQSTLPPYDAQTKKVGRKYKITNNAVASHRSAVPANFVLESPGSRLAHHPCPKPWHSRTYPHAHASALRMDAEI